MLEQIRTYLEQAGKPVRIVDIFQEVLHARIGNAERAAQILRSILGEDPSFVLQDGYCSLRPSNSAAAGFSVHSAAFLVVQASSSGWPRRLRAALHISHPASLHELEMSSAAAGVDRTSLEQLLAALQNRFLVMWHERELHLWNHLLRVGGISVPQIQTLFLRTLARAVLPKICSKPQPEDLAATLGLTPPDLEWPLSIARFYASCLPALTDYIPLQHKSDIQKVLAWLESCSPKVDFSRFGFTPESLQNIPQSPGVYVMRNRGGAIIYVGKSRDLRRRVQSYFAPRSLQDPKSTRIHAHIHTFDVICTSSEVEALLLEMRMIRDFKPPINLQSAVHEQVAHYGKDQNFILMVPSSEGRTAELYLFREGRFAAQQRVRLGRPATSRVRNRIRSVFFRPTRRSHSQEPWETEIVARWLSANRRRLNYIDVDEAGTYESTLTRLTDYLLDPDRLSRKVLYR